MSDSAELSPDVLRVTILDGLSCSWYSCGWRWCWSLFCTCVEQHRVSYQRSPELWILFLAVHVQVKADTRSSRRINVDRLRLREDRLAGPAMIIIRL
jgi:hypothetical protein